MRKAFIDSLCRIAADNDDVWLMCGDLGYSVLEVFAERFPERYVNAGIAEQNMVGMAAGLAMAGKIVVTYSIANFAIVRCLEQLRNDVCYHAGAVIVVSVGSGAAYGAQGYTHHGIEDMAFTRLLPNMAVMSPGDPIETDWALRRLIERRAPASLRLGRGGEPTIHDPATFKAEFGKAIEMRPIGDDVTLLSTGAVLPEAVAAAKTLAERGLSVGLYSIPAVEPLDDAAIRAIAARSRIVITAEEHVSEGGFGGAVAEVMSGLGSRARLLRAGVQRNGPKTAADQKEMRRLHGIDAAGLIARAEAALKGE